MRLLLLLLLLLGRTTPQAANAGIEGVVFRTGTSEPIPRAEITLTLSDKTIATTSADGDGKFSLRGLAAGTYTIRIQRDGFFGSSTFSESSAQRLLDAAAVSSGIVFGDRAPTRGITETIEFAASQNLIRRTYYLTPEGVLTGQVRGNAGPLAGATVTALRLGYRSGQQTLIPIKTARVDDRGNFRITSLEAGEYFVRADVMQPEGDLRSYYPATQSPEESVLVRVEAGGESSRVDIFLSGLHTRTLSGTVANRSIVPPTVNQRTARFMLVPTNRDRILDGSTDVQNSVEDPADLANGKFEIRGVRPGTYDLVAAFSERVVGATTSFRFPMYVGRTRVVVGSEDVRGVSLNVSSGIQLRGRMVFAGDAVLPAGSRYRVSVFPAAGFPLVVPASAEVQTDGTFTIPAIPAIPSTVVVAGFPNDTYIADLRQDGRSVFDDGIFNVEPPNTSIEIVLSSPGAVVTGRVSASKQQATVVLVPLAHRANPMLYQRAMASASGDFLFSGVAPGAYRVFAFENIPESAELNSRFMDSFRDAGVEVITAAGRTSTIEIGLASR